MAKKKHTILITAHHVVSQDQKISRQALFQHGSPSGISISIPTPPSSPRVESLDTNPDKPSLSPNGPGKRRMAQAAPSSQRALSILRAPLWTIFQVILLSVGNYPPQSGENGEKERRLTDEPIDGKLLIPANGQFSRVSIYLQFVCSGVDLFVFRTCTLNGRILTLRQEDSHLHYRAIFPVTTAGATSPRRDDTAELIHDYFNLDVNLTELYERWSAADAHFLKKAVRFAGIRMLRQDPWENLVSFICSSNNNISRISQMVMGLVSAFCLPI